MRSFLYLSLTLLFLFSNCSKRKNTNKDNNPGVQKSANVTDVISVTKRSDKASNFSWKDSTGKTIDLDSYRGKVTLINFWATWCGPCKMELPDLIAISKEMADKDVKIIGVSTDRGANVLEDVSSFVAEKGIPYQIVISNEELDEAFGNIRLIPTTFVVDAEGKIAQTIVGARSKTAFLEAINAVLK
jgi:thiol-disulfide isomerase/thioredoxin